MVKCKKCGNTFKNEHGLGVHLHTCGKKKTKKPMGNGKIPKPLRVPHVDPKDGIQLHVPCDLGGAKFIVDISLGLTATAIRPA